MKAQRWKTTVVEEEERVEEDDVRNGGVWKATYREGGTKNGWEAINVVKKRGKTRFLDLTTDKKRLKNVLLVVQTTGHDTDAVREIQSEMHLCFPEYIFRINTILVNIERKCIPENEIRNTSAYDSFVWTTLHKDFMWSTTSKDLYKYTISGFQLQYQQNTQTHQRKPCKFLSFS